MRVKFFSSFTTVAVAFSMLAVGLTPAAAVDNSLQEYTIAVPEGQIQTVVNKIEAEGGIVKEAAEDLNTIVAEIPTNDAATIDSLQGVTVVDEIDIRPAVETNPANDTTVSPVLSWGLDRIDQMFLPLSNSYSYPSNKDGEGVYVYVVDTGVNSDHAEFEGRVIAGYDGIKDGNGTNDCYGHGTHVAGTIAGANVGVAPDAYIVPVRVFNCSGGSSGSAFYGGLQFVLDDWAAKGYPPAVVNMSLSGSADSVLDNAMSIMAGEGLFIAVAAGNNNANACSYSPARSAAVTTAGSTTSTDVRSSFSNYGSCVDIFAPGSSITSTYITSNTTLSFMSGTSMAAPHVTGAAARYLSSFPEAGKQEITDAILNSATKNVLSNIGTDSPNRLLNVNPNGYAKPASEPLNVNATPGDHPTKAYISWDAPASDGGGSITDYKVTVSTDNGVTGDLTRSTGGAKNYIFTGLTPGVEYSFNIAAVNQMGEGATAVSNTITLTALPPSIPTNLKIDPTSNIGEVNVSWTPSNDNGGSAILGYKVEYFKTSTPEAVTTIERTPEESTATLTGLDNDVEYTINVKAYNAVGDSQIVAQKITLTSETPNTPTNVTSVQKTGSVNTAVISWDPPVSDGGNRISEYIVTVSSGAGVTGELSRSAGLNTSYEFTGLAVDAEYTFTVQAKNANGLSEPSSSTSVIIIGTIAGAPTITKAIPSKIGQVNIYWNAPAYTGGTSITGYVLTVIPSDGSASKIFTLPSTYRSVAITGLKGQMRYTFYLTASNKYGNSFMSNNVNVTPYAQASAVRNVSVSYPVTLKTRFTWQRPVSLGGSAFLRYEIRWTTNDTNTTWSSWTSTGPNTYYIISNMPKGVKRYAEIRAVTVAGLGVTTRYAFTPTR